MSNAKKVKTEIDLWKKRYLESRKVFGNIYKDVRKDLKKTYEQAVK